MEASNGLGSEPGLTISPMKIKVLFTLGHDEFEQSLMPKDVQLSTGTHAESSHNLFQNINQRLKVN